jgi:hypothetical protein
MKENLSNLRHTFRSGVASRSVGLTFTLALLFACAAQASAQSSGVVRGSVTDANGASVTGASVRLENATSGYRQETATNDEGRYTFFNVPFNSYTLVITQANFMTARDEVVIRTNVPIERDITLAVAGIGEQVEITSESNSGIEPTRSEIAVDALSIENLTSALPSRQIESLVLSVPGIVRDGKGVFHARGAHNQSSFVIDGIPVSDQLSAIYANNFDARNIEGMSVQLGNIAPEFGNKASAVIQVTTQSGLGRGRPFFGSINLGGGSFGSGETSFKFGGESSSKKFGYFISAANSFTSRYLDPPFQNATADFGNGRVVEAGGAGLNNYGNGQSLFTRFDYVPGERDFFKLNIVVARSRFNIANTPSQELSGQRQVQQNRNLAVYPSWQHVFNDRWVMTIAPYLRFRLPFHFRARAIRLSTSASRATCRLTARWQTRATLATTTISNSALMPSRFRQAKPSTFNSQTRHSIRFRQTLLRPSTLTEVCDSRSTRRSRKMRLMLCLSTSTRISSLTTAPSSPRLPRTIPVSQARRAASRPRRSELADSFRLTYRTRTPSATYHRRRRALRPLQVPANRDGT